MKIILASKSGVRKKILDDYKIDSDVVLSNVDEDEVKTSLSMNFFSILNLMEKLVILRLKAIKPFLFLIHKSLVRKMKIT